MPPQADPAHPTKAYSSNLLEGRRSRKFAKNISRITQLRDAPADNRCYGDRVVHTAGPMSPAGKEVADEAKPAVTPTGAHRQGPASRRGRLWLWIGRVLLALVGLVLVLVLAGLVYQFVATRLAYRRYPAPGEMVAVSGHGMQLYCAGKARGGRPS